MHKFYIDKESSKNSFYTYWYKNNDSNEWDSKKFRILVDFKDEIEINVNNILTTAYEESLYFYRTINSKFYHYIISGNVGNFYMDYMNILSMSNFCEIKDYPNKMIFELYNLEEFARIEHKFNILKQDIEKAIPEYKSLLSIRQEENYSVLVIKMPNELLNKISFLKPIFTFLNYYAEIISENHIDRDLVCPYCFSPVNEKYNYYSSSRLDISIYRNLSKDVIIKCPECGKEINEDLLIEIDSPMIDVCSKINEMFKEFTFPITNFCCSSHNIMHTCTPYIAVKNINLTSYSQYPVHLGSVIKRTIEKNEKYSELFRLGDSSYNPDQVSIYFKDSEKFLKWVKATKVFDLATKNMVEKYIDLFEDIYKSIKNYQK